MCSRVRLAGGSSVGSLWGSTCLLGSSMYSPRPTNPNRLYMYSASGGEPILVRRGSTTGKRGVAVARPNRLLRRGGQSHISQFPSSAANERGFRKWCGIHGISCKEDVPCTCSEYTGTRRWTPHMRRSPLYFRIQGRQTAHDR